MVQYKLLMEKCWASHWEIHAEDNLALMQYQDWFYQDTILGLLGLVILILKGLERVIHWVIIKYLGLEIN